MKNNGNGFSNKAQKLALEAKNDKDALSELICLYMKNIQNTVSSMAISIDEVSDLSQEALMGLCDAVKTYDESKGAQFTTYANVCIRNKILSALRKKPLATDEITEEIQDDKYDVNPEFSVVDKVRVGELMEIISKRLSKTEWEVFDRYVRGKSYEGIAKELSVTTKNVDNAMQRVRKKLKAVLDGENSN
ncbi:MAG: sigma-70 family RNA polymerase sigma factor [Oscillospiraceae bacterium]|nr:sigma-70 family RNA polymerase sigma factor [Oscillospiraceae bacterium]